VILIRYLELLSCYQPPIERRVQLKAAGQVKDLPLDKRYILEIGIGCRTVYALVRIHQRQVNVAVSGKNAILNCRVQGRPARKQHVIGLNGYIPAAPFLGNSEQLCCRYRGLSPKVARQPDICVKGDTTFVETDQGTTNVKCSWLLVARLQELDFHIFGDKLLLTERLSPCVQCLRQVTEHFTLNPPSAVLELPYFYAGIANQNPVDDEFLVEYQAINGNTDAHAIRGAQPRRTRVQGHSGPIVRSCSRMRLPCRWPRSLVP
jgi:hypothetical protein